MKGRRRERGRGGSGLYLGHQIGARARRTETNDRTIRLKSLLQGCPEASRFQTKAQQVVHMAEKTGHCTVTVLLCVVLVPCLLFFDPSCASAIAVRSHPVRMSHSVRTDLYRTLCPITLRLLSMQRRNNRRTNIIMEDLRFRRR
jgi:hypothetical protein